MIRQSDPKNVEFRNTLNGFAALRRYFIYAVVASARGREKWEFTADRDPSGAVKAGLTISDAGEVYGNGRTPFENAMVSVPLYRLFWSRVEYVLGRSNDWPTCDDAEAELKKTNTNTVAGLGGLCGPTSAGRDAEPPEQLAPIAKPTPAPIATPKREKAKQG